MLVYQRVHMLTLPFAAIAASKPLRSLENNGPHTFCLPLSDTPQVYCKCAIHWPYTSFCANMWQAMGPFQICGCPFHEPGVSEIVHMSYCHKCWPYIYIYTYIYIYIHIYIYPFCPHEGQWPPIACWAGDWNQVWHGNSQIQPAVYTWDWLKSS